MSLDNQISVPSRAQCICSTMGFESPLWNALYYPDNCPEEWRLAYFMNDLRAVYLPSVDWNQSEAQIQAIAGELDPGFELVIEWPQLTEGQSIETILSMLAPLRQNVTCVVVNIDGLSGASIDAIFRAIAEFYTINFYSRTLDVQVQQELVAEYETGFVWDPGQANSPVSSARYQVVRLPCRGLRDMRAVLDRIRPLIEQDIRVGLFFEPAEQSVNRAIEVRTLTELMGLA